MEAKVENRQGVYVVTLSGQLNFESADSLRATCQKFFREKRVIFNLEKLSFVGSSGLTPFLELLSEMNRTHGKDIKICSVSSEFIRLFEAGELYGLEIYDSESKAHMAFSQAYTPAVIAAPPTMAIDKVQPFGLDYPLEEDGE